MEQRVMTVAAATTSLATLLFLILVGASPVRAEGALALGKCDAWGWSASPSLVAAREKALADCQAHDSAACRVVATTHEGCVAVSTDQSAQCGASWWSTEATKSDAESASMGDCRNASGKSCAVLASRCDRTD